MRSIEAMQPLLLKKLEEIEAVWVGKGEGKSVGFFTHLQVWPAPEPFRHSRGYLLL